MVYCPRLVGIAPSIRRPLLQEGGGVLTLRMPACYNACMVIDTTTYSKLIWPHGRGYGYRRVSPPTSIVIHTTNGKIGSQFPSEARFLQNSPLVSAHYLIGKQGEVAEIVPTWCTAYHAGDCLSAWSNTRSIGIENHVAEGEQWTAIQHATLTELVRMLIKQFRIPRYLIETHRAIARPLKRKSDPTAWGDVDFYNWRKSLYT